MKREDLLAHWREGVDEYNSGRYWHAHESWERGWKTLSEPMRSWVQGCIQIAGAHHLLGQGRREPALRLLKRAAELLEAAAATRDRAPRIEIRGWSESSPGRAELVSE